MQFHHDGYHYVDEFLRCCVTCFLVELQVKWYSLMSWYHTKFARLPKILHSDSTYSFFPVIPWSCNSEVRILTTVYPGALHTGTFADNCRVNAQGFLMARFKDWCHSNTTAYQFRQRCKYRSRQGDESRLVVLSNSDSWSHPARRDASLYDVEGSSRLPSLTIQMLLSVCMSVAQHNTRESILFIHFMSTVWQSSGPNGRYTKINDQQLNRANDRPG